jgi:hypothetical protein
MDRKDVQSPGAVTRRELLRRGLKIGGAAWAIPIVQTIGMSPAQANDYDPSGGLTSGRNGSSGNTD